MGDSVSGHRRPYPDRLQGHASGREEGVGSAELLICCLAASDLSSLACHRARRSASLEPFVRINCGKQLDCECRGRKGLAQHRDRRRCKDPRIAGQVSAGDQHTLGRVAEPRIDRLESVQAIEARLLRVVTDDGINYSIRSVMGCFERFHAGAGRDDVAPILQQIRTSSPQRGGRSRIGWWQ